VAESFPHVDGVEHSWVDVQASDGPLRVHLAQAGEGPPLLLLHGWPQHWYQWRKLVPRLASDYRLLMPDLRGFGWSQAPGRGYDPLTFAADAVALLDALEIERVDLAGHDWGGYTAFLAGLSTPARLRRIVVLNAPVPWFRPSPALLGQLRKSWYAQLNAIPGVGRRLHERSLGWVTHNLRRSLVDSSAITAGEAGIFARRYRQPERALAAQQLYGSYVRAFTQGLRNRPFDALRLTVPTRLLFGVRDVMLSTALTQGWEGHADDMAVEYVEGCGHFIAEERPDLVAERIRAFMTA
jgi:pimeloyl-ACP methyl ester carboxylesterase